MFARKVSMHLKGSVPDFTQTLEREVIPCFENRRDSWTKSHLSHREERKHLHQFVGPGRKRGKLQPRSLRRSGEGPGEGD